MRAYDVATALLCVSGAFLAAAAVLMFIERPLRRRTAFERLAALAEG